MVARSRIFKILEIVSAVAVHPTDNPILLAKVFYQTTVPKHC